MISRQYAGTNALKGDYTRTGERNLSGLVKDGVNSASRYYLNHIRDTYRQAGLAIKNAHKKNHLKKPTKNVFFCFFWGF
jgi:hypothetical protein